MSCRKSLPCWVGCLESPNDLAGSCWRSLSDVCQTTSDVERLWLLPCLSLALESVGLPPMSVTSFLLPRSCLGWNRKFTLACYVNLADFSSVPRNERGNLNCATLFFPGSLEVGGEQLGGKTASGRVLKIRLNFVCPPLSFAAVVEFFLWRRNSFNFPQIFSPQRGGNLLLTFLWLVGRWRTDPSTDWVGFKLLT